MEDVIMQGQNREAAKKELLKHLQKLEEENWIIFGWNHMNLARRRWLGNPQKLADCDYYQKVIKNWLGEERIVAPSKYNPEGLVGYKEMDSGAFNVESVHFQLWLAKGAEVCAVSYSEHKFSNEISDKALGRAGFTVVFFEDWLKVVPKILNAKEER